MSEGKKEFINIFAEMADAVYKLNEEQAKLVGTVVGNLDKTLQSLVSKINLIDTRIDILNTRFDKLTNAIKSEGPFQLSKEIEEIPEPPAAEIIEVKEHTMPEDISKMDKKQLRDEQDNIFKLLKDMHIKEGEKLKQLESADDRSPEYREYERQINEMTQERLKLEERLRFIDQQLDSFS